MFGRNILPLFSWHQRRRSNSTFSPQQGPRLALFLFKSADLVAFCGLNSFFLCYVERRDQNQCITPWRQTTTHSRVSALLYLNGPSDLSSRRLIQSQICPIRCRWWKYFQDFQEYTGHFNKTERPLTSRRQSFYVGFQGGQSHWDMAFPLLLLTRFSFSI
jgi:hypothetical protein